MNLRTTFIITTIAILLAACAGSAERAEQRATAADRYMAYAGEPIDRFGYSRIQSWTPVSENQFVLWTRGNAYMLTVSRPCINLDYANRISLSSQSGTWVTTGTDFVTFDDQRCRILEIREVDDRRMKADMHSSEG